MNQQLLSLIDQAAFGLTHEDLSWQDQFTLVVKKWNWAYADAHAFQRASVGILQEFPRLRIYVACSHPHVLTNGRGLQKPRKGEVLELQDFVPGSQNLPFPLFQIERGGGLTFHHPGQYIFYPIVKLDPRRLSLSKLIDEAFDFSAEILTEWGLQGVSSEHKLLGLWVGEKKIASMGIAIERLTTFHGMALNLSHDEKMSAALRSLNPCGLSATTYTSVDQFISLPASPLEAFHTKFMEKVSHAWK